MPAHDLAAGEAPAIDPAPPPVRTPPTTGAGGRGAPRAAKPTAFVSTVPARPAQRRFALAVVLVSALGLVVAIPIARTPWPRIPAFIPAYESALAISDLISAFLLYGQFAELRRPALLALASGYLFCAMMAVPHALTFPGVFSATGLLGAGTQTTGWLYVFWHGGFALATIAYGVLGRRDNDARAGAGGRRPLGAIAATVAVVAACAILLTLAATRGESYLPVLIQGTDFSLLIKKGISPTLLALCVVSLLVLVPRRKPTVLDLWVMVVLCAWLCDVALSAVVASARFDLGWYVGRVYGLLAANFVLIVLLLETNGLHGRLAAANAALAEHAHSLGVRVRDRTEELAQSNSALRREIAERQETERQLVHAQKMEAIGNLTGGMAHDFNNLLGVVIGNLDLLRETAKRDPAIDELAQEALDAALKGADLTKRLLAFARRQPLQPRLIEINSHVSGISKLLGRVLGEQISMRYFFADDVWPVMADPAQLEASLTNLATNARDAMPNGGSLTIRTENRVLDEDYAAQHAELRPGDYAMIEVSDTGSGIPAETLSRIFEPFYTTKPQGKGTGLGLSMVFGFMKQSGGHINVYSELGKGTTFRLYLPRALDAGAAAAARVPAAPPRGGSETVLVVEDNPGLRRAAVQQLRNLGYRVLEADTGHAALAVMAQEPVALMFSDVVMPGGVDGFTLSETVRERWPAVKIVLTSGFADAAFGGSAAVTVLTKPYRRDELARALRDALDS